MPLTIVHGCVLDLADKGFMDALRQYEAEIRRQPKPTSSRERRLRDLYARNNTSGGGLDANALRRVLIECGESANDAKDMIELCGSGGTLSEDQFLQAWGDRDCQFTS